MQGGGKQKKTGSLGELGDPPVPLTRRPLRVVFSLDLRTAKPH